MFAASKTAGAVSAAPPASSDPQFNYVSLLLNDTGTNGQQNNTFLDSSSNNFTITRNGTPTQGSVTPYWPDGQWSNYFSGSGQHLTYPSGAGSAFGTGDFTVELWFFRTVSTAANYYLIDNRNASQTGTWAFLFDNTAWKMSWYNGSSSLTSGVTPTNNQWNHVAYSRSGTTGRLFLNGSQIASWTDTTNYSVSSTTAYIGARFSAAENFAGYMSNVRIVKGTALYTSNFTPSTTPLTAVSGTSLLTCQSNRFKDNSSNNFAITVTGTPTVQAFEPFEPASSYATSVGGSGFFNGTTDFVTTTETAAFDMTTVDFTVETWVYPTGTNASGIVRNPNASSFAGFAIVWNSSRFRMLFSYNGTAWAFDLGTSSTYPLNTWYHLALVRNGATATLYVNGVSAITANLSTNSLYGGQPLYVGYGRFTTTYFPGYISNLRIVKGTAVYTSNFTPPTSPVTAISGTSLLLNCTNAGIYDAATLNDLVTVGNAQVSTAQAKFGSSSMAFDGTGDYLQSVPNALYDFGTGDFTIECWFYIAGNSALNNNGTRDGCVFGLSSGASLAGSLIILGNSTTTGTGLQLFKSTNTVTNVSATVSISQNAWHHVAATKSGTSVRLFLDGSQVGTTVTSSTIWGSSTFTPYVGANQATGYIDHFNGYIEDIRITKGYARYTANFTPPTAPFPTR